MEKELFVDTMNKIKSLAQEQEAFNDMLRRIDDNFGGGYIHHKSISILEELLSKLMNDQWDNISYWMWELDFGDKYVDGCVTEADGTIIKLQTPEELYDFIMSEQK